MEGGFVGLGEVADAGEAGEGGNFADGEVGVREKALSFFEAQAGDFGLDGGAEDLIERARDDGVT